MTGPVAPYLRHISWLMGPISMRRLRRMMLSVTRARYIFSRGRIWATNSRVPWMNVVIHVVVEPADAVVAVGQAGAGDAFEQVENLLPVIEGIEQRGEAAQVEQEGAPPDEVAGDAVQFGGDDADILRARRHLELRGAFHGPHEAVGVGHRRQVINAAGVGEELRVGAVLAHLFLHPVDVAAHRFGADDVFAVHRHLDAQHAVGGGMLRAQVE